MMEDIKKTLESADNEYTRAPYWMILNPYSQMMDKDVYTLASMITGPFFSREDAENFLNATRYNFSKRAVVFCMSGCYSKKYCELWDKIDKKRKVSDEKNNS